MDCIKNLTACLGCTKKHAKCSWREVRVEELAALTPSAYDAAFPPQPQEQYLNAAFEDEELELRRRLQEVSSGGQENVRTARTAQMVPLTTADDGGEQLEPFPQQEVEEVPSPRVHSYPPVPTTGSEAVHTDSVGV